METANLLHIMATALSVVSLTGLFLKKADDAKFQSFLLFNVVFWLAFIGFVLKEILMKLSA